MNEWERRSRFVTIDGKVYARTKYINFILEMGLGAKLTDSGYTSPKLFVRERCNREWIAHQVVKRINHEQG